MTTQLTEAQAAAQLAQKPFIDTSTGVPIIFTPSQDGGWSFAAKEDLLPTPIRKRGNVVMHDVESFIKHCKLHGTPANSVVYMDVDYSSNKVNAKAVFNDHGNTTAGWRDHTANFNPRTGSEWATWLGKNKHHFDQQAFAEFLETNVADIVVPENSSLPSGSDILTFVSNLEETRTVTYGSAINLQNGMVQIEFTEEGDKGTKGKLELFKEFAIGVIPFFGGDAYSIRALLRYRIDRNTGQIKFWYELQRTDKVLEDASKAVIESIKEGTGFPVVFGTTS